MIRFLFFLLCFSSSFLFSHSRADDVNLTSSAFNSPLEAEGRPPPAASLKENQSKAPFKPGVVITIGALTSVFSLTFLILLYVKHCKSSNSGYPNTSRGGIDYSYTTRKNSGIDPNVIDLLPVFRFGSLRGPKDGLECAVCLTNYEASEVLRLLPKCKHAFHVECVDTWLDAHSTCPLCRYRVDPEDFLLIEHNKLPPPQEEKLVPEIHRISGRHSSAGEKGGRLQVIVEKPLSMGSRRSLDSSISSGSVSIGCFDRPRKDQLLLSAHRPDRRIQHRIVVSSEMTKQRWSDVQASELLYIKSEMLMSDSRRVSAANGKEVGGESNCINEESGRNEIKKRSVSEITGISRRRSNEVGQRQEEGFVYRWLAWISDSNPSPAGPLPQPTTTTTTTTFSSNNTNN